MQDAQVHSTAWSYVLNEPLRILVADDDPILREFASVHLSTPAATIVTAPDGNAAIDLLKSSHFNLAIFDIEMPGLNGFGALEMIRQDAALKQLPVIMLTGHEDIASIDRSFALGANAFVSKPVNWRLLSYQIRYVLRSCSLESELRELSVAAETMLRGGCEAILREAQRSLQPPFATIAAESALQRIAELAGTALRSATTGAANMDAAIAAGPNLEK